MTAKAFPLLASIFLFMVSPGAWANATTLSVSGEVQVTPKGGSSARLAEGQRVDSGAALKTGPNSGVTIRFDDGQMVALTSNSNLVIDEYRFNPHKPEEGGILTSLLRGGMRMVTGLIGKAKPESVKITTPVATIGIRGTDFQLFVESRLFTSVGDGTIGVANVSGETLFDGAKQPLGIVPDAQTKARAATLSEFSADAVAAMRRLDIEPNFGTRKPNPNDPSCADR
jgi:hypothetical protein